MLSTKDVLKEMLSAVEISERMAADIGRIYFACFGRPYSECLCVSTAVDRIVEWAMSKNRPEPEDLL